MNETGCCQEYRKQKEQKEQKGRKNMTDLKNVQKRGNTVGEGIKFERIRRITGYLVGTTDRFNNAKRAEERDRVKHGL